ncbi:MAG: tetratricopeptide repeat protein, partial [bacterium]
YLGQCLEKEYNFEIAMEQYEKALNIDPYFIEARIALAKIYQMNDPKRAIEILEEVADDYQDKEILYLLAQLYYSQKNYKKSLEISQKLIKINPDDYNIFYLYTLSLINVYKQGYNVEKEILMKNLEIIYNRDPNNPVISSEFLKLCVDESDFVKAKQILEKSNVNLKNKEIAEKVALIYLQDQEYEKLINTIKTNELFSYDFINQVFTYLKENDSPYISVLYNQTLDISKKEWKEEQIVKFKLDYLEYLYFSNTLQGLEFYKQLLNEKFFAENLNERYNLTLFGLLIYFTLYTEYKDKKYLDNFISVADNLFLNGEFLDESKLSNSKFSQKIVDNIRIVFYFYFLVIKSKNDLIPKVYDYLINSSSKTNILTNFLSEALPIFLDNNYHQEVLNVIQKFDLQNISSFKKIKIETLFLLGRNSEVINEAEEYLDKFSYDSYVELLKIVADFEVSGNYELYIDNIEKIVMESNPLALAIYAKILASKNINEAIRYADRAMEFIYTGKHSFKNTYQLVMIIEILSRFYESVYKLSYFIKGLKQIVSKYPDVYAFNYILAKALLIVEDFVDAELIAKKALKLTGSSNSLLQTQNLLSKIREEKENYQKLLYELQKINPQIPEKIAYINTLYKKDKISEIYKLLDESQENTIDKLIIRFYIFDKLEIKEQIIYHLNLLKIFAIENSLEALAELIENKLLFYSNVEEFEEIKSKAEIDYLKVYKKALEKEIKQIVSDETAEQDVFQEEVSQEEVSQEEVSNLSFSSLEDYYKFQEAKIINYKDLLIAYKLRLIYILFEDNKKYQQVGNVIANSNIGYIKESVAENEKSTLEFLDKVTNLLTKNDLKNLLKEIKEFSNNFPDQKFIILLSLFVLGYRLRKESEYQKYMNQLRNIAQNNQIYKKIIELIERYQLQKTPEQQKILSPKLSLSQIQNYQDIKESYINSFNELILAYLLKIFFLLLNQKENYEILNNKIVEFENKYETKEELQNHSLISFFKKIFECFMNNDLKSCLLEIKSFDQRYKNYSFFINFVLLFLNYKLKRKGDFERLKKFLLANEDKEQEFKNLISWIEGMEVEYENISNQ